MNSSPSLGSAWILEDDLSGTENTTLSAFAVTTQD